MSRDEGIVDASAVPAVGIKSRGDVLCATHGEEALQHCSGFVDFKIGL